MSIKKEPTFSLFIKFFLIILVSFFLLQSLIFLGLQKLIRQQEEERILRENKSIASLFADTLRTNYLSGAWSWKFFRKTMLSSDMLFWWVVRSDGTILMSNNENDWGRQIQGYRQKGITQVKDSIFRKTGERIKLIIEPIRISPEKIWSLYLGISLQPIETLDSYLINLYKISLLVFAFFSLFLAFFLSKYFTRPISSLTREIQDISQSLNFKKRVRIFSHDEIGILAQSFNHLLAELGKNYEALELSKKTVQASEKRFKSLLQSIGDGVFAIDNKKKIILFNGAAERITGWRSDEVLGKPCSEVFKMSNEKGDINICRTRCPIDQVFKTKKQVPLGDDVCLTTKSGEKVPVADSAAPVFNARGYLLGGIVVFRDVSKEKKIARMKTEFVSLASHQLRTPMTIIKWSAELLASKLKGKLKKDETKNLNQISRGIERLIALVNDLLNVSRLESGRLVYHKELIDFNGLVKSVINEYQLLIASKKMKVTFNREKALPKIEGDPLKIRQVIKALLENSLKYSHKRKKINIKTSIQGNQLLFEIKDEGVGIPLTQQDRIFTKFFRADNVREMDEMGTGLGLYLARGIIEAEGGRIWFESQENKGTTFYFTLPLKPQTKGQPLGSSAASV